MDSTIITLALLLGGLYLYERVSGGPGAASIAGAAGTDLGTSLGDAAANTVKGSINGFILGGENVCQIIQAWRVAGAPAIVYVSGFPLIGNIQSGGGNPNDWNLFRQYMLNSAFVDPGPNPPACW